MAEEGDGERGLEYISCISRLTRIWVESEQAKEGRLDQNDEGGQKADGGDEEKKAKEAAETVEASSGAARDGRAGRRWQVSEGEGEEGGWKQGGGPAG